MEYYIEGNPDKADQIEQFFKSHGYNTCNLACASKDMLYFTVKGHVRIYWCDANSTMADVLRTSEACYKHIELSKFKIGDILQDIRFSKSSPVEICAIDYERQDYVVIDNTRTEVHISFTCIHEFYDYYDEKEVALPFEAGDLILGRDKDSDLWRVDIFSHVAERSSYFFCAGHAYRQCIPFKGNTHLTGTSQKCCKQYPSWCYGKPNSKRKEES
jgi:hypothetical protein